MNKIKIFWLSALNFQLIIGFFTCYNFLYRHIIINNVLLFIFCVFVLSNILFFLAKRPKFESLKIFFSITISSLLLMFIFMEKRNISWNSSLFSDLLLIIPALIFYTITLLKLYITVPLLIVFEVFLRKNKS